MVLVTCTEPLKVGVCACVCVLMLVHSNGDWKHKIMGDNLWRLITQKYFVPRRCDFALTRLVELGFTSDRLSKH